MVHEIHLRFVLRAALAVLTALLSYSPASQADEVTTSFEFNATGPFSIGTPPILADFSAGVAETRGNPALYRSGAFAWHIRSGETAVVNFQTPASSLQFFARTDRAGVTGQIRVFDESGTEVHSQEPTDIFRAVTVQPADGESLIASVELSNQGGGDIVVDDFFFIADEIVEPPAFDPDNPIPARIARGSVQVMLTEVAVGLVAPNFAITAPGDSNRLFVVDQPGQVVAIDLATGDQSVYLDVADFLVPLGVDGPGTFDERGLLGLAFHSDFQTNGLLYTYTSEPVGATADFSTIPAGSMPDHQTVIREFVTPDPSDPESQPDTAASREILRLDQPQFNHNAGALLFDNTGNLFIAVGDGGGADDVDGQVHREQAMIGHGSGNGQDPSNPFGAILRIDPLGADSANAMYGIPADNPFIGRTGFVEEIYAYGFRNPFRLALDPLTSDLYAADVGQNHIEEINIVVVGGNYGWNLKEGSFFFDANGDDAGFVSDQDPGVPAGLVDPIAEYDHNEGIAIIGGFVYRGAAIPGLAGRFVFGDFVEPSFAGGRAFYLDGTDMIRSLDTGTGGTLPFFLLGFGQDAAGEIYVLGNATATPFDATGVVQRLDVLPPPPPPLPPPAPPSSGGGGSTVLLLFPLLAALVRRWRARTTR